MKYWPVPNSYSKKIPVKGTPGSFWEDRGDRRHCGIDIYAPKSSNVLLIDNGKVKDIGVFTSSKKIPYWNLTKYIITQDQEGVFYKYAELEDVTVKVDQIIKAGQLIGHVGTVLNLNKITKKSPKYIQEIKKKSIASMLHLEVYNSENKETNKYHGGNWFGSKKPKNLVDPTLFLLSTIRDSYP